MQNGEPVEPSSMQHHAIATAHTTRAIVKQINGTSEDYIFLAGLTHHAGKVLLLNGMTQSLFKKGETKPVNREEVLSSIQGVHASFGGAILKRWGFHDELISAVNNHAPRSFIQCLKNKSYPVSGQYDDAPDRLQYL
jgi:HD-like signal output (HDOD) protein